jgi:hypothetical protein
VECQRIVARKETVLPVRVRPLAGWKGPVAGAVRVLGALLGPEATGRGHPPGGGAPRTLFRLSRARPRPLTFSVACRGCDGVVVWELHSGREHLVDRGLRVPVRIAISYDLNPVACLRACVSWFFRL